jgi:hypothetical protein
LTLRSWVNTDSAGQPLRLRLAPACLGQLHCAGGDLLGEMILQDHGEVRRELPGPVISWLGPAKAAVKLHTLLDLRGSIADPKHERHAELKEWWGSEPYDLEVIEQ